MFDRIINIDREIERTRDEEHCGGYTRKTRTFPKFNIEDKEETKSKLPF